MFTYLCGTLQCVKCGIVALESIQTKLFFTDESNCSHEYRQGSSVLVDGLCDYCELWPINDSPVLNVVLGVWDCRSCHLNWQWAKAELSILRGSVRCFEASVTSVSTFVPRCRDDFLGVHFVEEELAVLAFPSYSRANLERFCNWSIEERIDAILAGYQRWHREMVK